MRESKNDWTEARAVARAAELISEFERKGQAPPGREQAPVIMTSQLKLYIKEKERRALIQNDSEFRAYVRRLVGSTSFNYFIMALIFTNAILVSFDDHSAPYLYAELIFFCIYLFEFQLKLYAERSLYWKNSYNLLDFCLLLISAVQIILSSYLPYVNLTYLRVIRGFFNLVGLRALRALRSISLFRSLQVVVNALGRTIRSTMLDIVLLMFLFMFLFAIIGFHLFGETSAGHIAEFANLPASILTVFVFTVADGWTVRQQELDVAKLDGNRVFVMVVIIIGNFIFLNLFVGVISNNIEQAQTAEKKLQAKKRQQLKKYKKELFAKKQMDEIAQLVAHQKKMNTSNLQDVLKNLAGQLHHDDLSQMTHLSGDLTWLQTFMISLHYHELSMHRCQQIHFELANTLAELTDRKLDRKDAA